MKIHPPEVVCSEKAPFEGALFGRKALGDSMTQLLRSVEDNVVIFINAPWGEGKTTFARMWRKQLEVDGLPSIYFDAYRSDHVVDPFVAFTGEILIHVKNHLAEMEGIEAPSTEFKKTAVEVGKRLAGLGTKIGLRLLSAGALETSDIKQIKGVTDVLVDGVCKIGAEVVEKKIEDYAAEKDALASFRASLEKLASLIREKQAFPLTIVIDELDRCRPDFALNLLERIKHLFDVKGIAFVLLVNREQLEGYIHAVYGPHVDARSYLLKFGSLFVDLPCEAPRSHFEKGREEYAQSLIAHFGLKVANGQTFTSCVKVLATHMDLTLREIEKAFVVLSLYYGALKTRDGVMDLIPVTLAYVKVKKPGLYRRLRDKSVSYEDFAKELGLDSLGDRELRSVYVRDVFKYCLLDEKAYQSVCVPAGNGAPSGPQMMGQAFWNYHSRDQILPSYCEHLDRFSVSPT